MRAQGVRDRGGWRGFPRVRRRPRPRRPGSRHRTGAGPAQAAACRTRRSAGRAGGPGLRRASPDVLRAPAGTAGGGPGPAPRSRRRGPRRSRCRRAAIAGGRESRHDRHPRRAAVHAGAVVREARGEQAVRCRRPGQLGGYSAPGRERAELTDRAHREHARQRGWLRDRPAAVTDGGDARHAVLSRPAR